MKGRFSAAIAMALAIGSLASHPLTENTDSPSRSKGPTAKRKSLTRFSWRYNRKYSRPHQGAQEIARRKHQIERGILQVSKP